MTAFKILLICAALLLAPAEHAAAAELLEQGGSISENSIQYETDVEQDNQDSSLSVTISDNNIADSGSDPEEQQSTESEYDYENNEYAVMPLADYDSYYGSISTTYVEYMRGYLSKLEPDMHYVGARVGQYEYIFAFGDLSYSGDSFSGDNINVVTWNTQNTGSFSSSVQSSFSLSPGSYLVYTDLGFDYPALATSSDISLRQIVYVIAISISFYTIGSFFVRKSTRSRSRRWRG